MICIYRYSEKGKDPRFFGYKESKKDCWESFKMAFKEFDRVVITDNTEDTTLFKGEKVIKTNLGNSGSAAYAMQYAMENFPDEAIYFAEDDYLYKKDSGFLLEEALLLVDYATLYDHGDKYKNFNGQPNPFLSWLGEDTNLFRTKSTHWKLTNSTTMTFAAKSSTIKDDFGIISKHLNGHIPLDFQMFLALGNKGKTLASSIPGFSTHLSPDKDNCSPFFHV